MFTDKKQILSFAKKYDIIFLICFGGAVMAFSYNKLWKLLIDKEMTRSDLKEASGVSVKCKVKT